MEETRTCSKCDTEKPVGEFTRYKGKPTRTCQVCATRLHREWKRLNRERVEEYRVKWREANPDVYREITFRGNLWFHHRMAPETYEAMLQDQGGACAVCRKPETKVNARSGLVQRLSVDHDHRCCPGKGSCPKCWRGLVCDSCNNRIGRAEPIVLVDPDVVEYLQAHRRSHSPLG